MVDLITTAEAARMMGHDLDPSHARRRLHDWGVRPVARQPGSFGANLYRRDDVERAIARAPGQGARTDLHED